MGKITKNNINPTNPTWQLGFGCPVANGGGGKWDETVGWAGKGGGWGACSSACEGEEAGAEKPENRAVVARFRVCIWKGGV
jgi:hypothetical protein